MLPQKKQFVTNPSKLNDKSRCPNERSGFNLSDQNKSLRDLEQCQYATRADSSFGDSEVTRLRRNISTDNGRNSKEPTQKGGSPGEKCSSAQYNNQTQVQQRAQWGEQPQWFYQMSRHDRDNLEKFFAHADKKASGNPEAIRLLIQEEYGLDSKQCTEIYNYFMRSEFVYKPSSKNRVTAKKSSQILSFSQHSREPVKYDGPLRGKGNNFWFKIRNPELKEQIEAAEGPVLTPTQTPDTTPEPQEIEHEKSD